MSLCCPSPGRSYQGRAPAQPQSAGLLLPVLPEEFSRCLPAQESRSSGGCLVEAPSSAIAGKFGVCGAPGPVLPILGRLQVLTLHLSLVHVLLPVQWHRLHLQVALQGSVLPALLVPPAAAGAGAGQVQPHLVP